MPRFSKDGIEHPTQSDAFDVEGLYHIGECAECQEMFPETARIARDVRESDPAGHEKIRARIEARR